MSKLIRKSFSISTEIQDEISEIISMSLDNGLDLSESAVVRMALTKGLSAVRSTLQTQESIDEQREAGSPADV